MDDQTNLDKIYEEIIERFSGERLSTFILKHKDGNILEQVIQRLERRVETTEGDEQRILDSKGFLEKLYEIRKNMELKNMR